MKKGWLAAVASAVAAVGLAAPAVAGASGSAAKADTTCARVWLVKQDGSKQPVGDPYTCQETGMERTFGTGADPTVTGAPGPYKGVGVDIEITTP